MGMHIDARPRYILLQKALKTGESESESQHYKIVVRQIGPALINIKFFYDGTLVTTYSPDHGAIIEQYATRLYESTKDIMAVEQAISEALICASSPVLVHTAYEADWTFVNDPIKVKHRKDTFGKPLLTIPIRRQDAQRGNVDGESWVEYSFRRVNPPEDAKRPGGYGRGCPK